MPEPGWSTKPRSSGYTMILDKGFGPRGTEDLMATASDYIDSLKFTFGTSALYDERILCEKARIVRSAGVDVYPGGTFLEVAVWRDRYTRYLRRARELGFMAIEVSDGTLKMTDEQRADCIKRGLDAGFKVLTEVGKKSHDEKIAVPEMQRQTAGDLELGAMMVIVEAREGGKGVAVFDHTGAVDEGEVDAIIAGVENLDKLMWEAP
jgi:phosphosulfolactate synthase